MNALFYIGEDIALYRNTIIVFKRKHSTRIGVCKYKYIYRAARSAGKVGIPVAREDMKSLFIRDPVEKETQK